MCKYISMCSLGKNGPKQTQDEATHIASEHEYMIRLDIRTARLNCWIYSIFTHLFTMCDHYYAVDDALYICTWLHDFINHCFSIYAPMYIELRFHILLCVWVKLSVPGRLLWAKSMIVRYKRKYVAVAIFSAFHHSYEYGTAFLYELFCCMFYHRIWSMSDS